LTYLDREYLVGILIGAFAVGAYLVGLLRGQRHPLKWRQFFAGMTDPLTRTGFAWALALPACWILLYYALVAHVRLSLGRWPKFGENLAGWALSFHYQAVELLLVALVGSLCVAAAILVGCLVLPRWRYVSVYALCYGAGVGVAVGSLFLAPHSFLNWFLD